MTARQPAPRDVTAEIARLRTAAESADRDAAAEWPGSYYRKAHKARARRLRRKADALEAPADHLTAPQAALLAQVAEAPRRYNYRAASRIQALEAAGLATADWDADLDATKGRLRWRILVTPTDAGRAWLAAARNDPR